MFGQGAIMPARLKRVKELDVSFLVLILFWLFFCVAASLFAEIRRNRSRWWFLTAFLFSPLVAFTLLFILLPLPPRTATARSRVDVNPDFLDPTAALTDLGRRAA
jgi:hypothetical protein